VVIAMIPVLADQIEDEFKAGFFWVIAVIAVIWVLVKNNQKKTIISESKQIRQNKLEAKINAIKSGSSQSSINNNPNTPSF